MSMKTMASAAFAALTLVTQAALPAGYARLAWIKSSGGQYIDTGVKLRSPGDRVQMAFRCTKQGDGGTLFGSRKDAYSYCFYAHYNSKWLESNFSININNGDLSRWENSSSVSFTDALMEIDASPGAISVWRNGILESTFVPTKHWTFETLSNCTVLKAFPVEGGSLGNVNGAIGKLYLFRIFRGNDLLLDLIPVRNANGDVGMYDQVSNDFFENKGEGTFEAGPELSPLTIATESDKLACSPEVGGVACTPGESVTCTAVGSTNVLDWIRQVPACVLQKYDLVSENWGAPLTNASATYVHTQLSNECMRLTWIAREEARLAVNAYSNGTLTVNGAAMPEPADYARKLPAEYEALEYIQSSGVEYIDTGIKLKSPDDRVYMAFRCTSLGGMPPNRGGVLFGNRLDAWNKCFMAHYNSWTTTDFVININDVVSGTMSRWECPSETVSFTDTLLELDASPYSMSVWRDGELVSTYVPNRLWTYETLGSCTVLKGVAVEGGSLPNANGAIGRLYRFVIARKGVAVLDLIPVRKNGEAGMYDCVSGEFFGNVSGTGAFTAGPVVAQTDVHSELWLPLGSQVTLAAQSRDGFLGWTGDVEESEKTDNPLLKMLTRGLTITPSFPKPKTGLILLFR